MNFYTLRYFHVPTGRWFGSRCYEQLDLAADDYVELASMGSIGAVEIFAPDQSLLWHDAWVDLPLVTAVARVRDAVAAVKALGG